jgi:hypothetical protein
MVEKRLHVPMVDRTPEEPPPVVIAVVGPPGVTSSFRLGANSAGRENNVN